MRQSTFRNRRRSGGFTLVELLVVIGIIALLIAILLPALNRARRQASTVKCSSNMHQIALALLSYINDNNGILPPALVSPGTQKTTDATNPYYPIGWFWASELVKQHYIKAPNLFQSTTATNWNYYGDSNPFECPEGTEPDSANVLSDGTASSNFTGPPTARVNMAAVYGVLPSGAPTVGNGGPPYTMVATWYELCQTIINPDSVLGGPTDAPFVFFDITQNGTLTKKYNITGLGPLLSCSYFTRKASQVRHSASMAMIVEACTPEWLMGGKSGASITDGNTQIPTATGDWMPCLAARHGQKTADGNNASTNIAFFDGHVDLLPTVQLDHYTVPNSTTPLGGPEYIPQNLSGVVFTIERDKF